MPQRATHLLYRQVSIGRILRTFTRVGVLKPRPLLKPSEFPRNELVESTGLARSTIKNEINRLKKAGRLEPTGEVKGQMEQVRRVDLRTRPIKKKSAKSAGEPTTVAELFASPPLWLATQLEAYRKDPERHIEPLCSAVAVVVLNDGTRGPDVRAEVEKEVERQGR